MKKYNIINFQELKEIITEAVISEMNKRMTYINSPVSEGRDSDYDDMEDFVERRDRQLCEIATFLKIVPKKPIPWKTIPASLLKKTWLIFGKYNRVNVNDIDKIADQILTNIVRLRLSNEFSGHSSNYHLREEVVDKCGIEFTDKEWDDNCWRFENISDYGLPPLERIYSVIFSANTPEEKLYACDKALNVVHQRSDLAQIFVQGGTSTLTAIGTQGGYSPDREYGDVNREFAHNRAVSEMATISKSDNGVMADNTPLKDMDVESVKSNIVMFRNPTDGFIAKGYTLVYFMDSDQAAQDIIAGKIPYLMVPRGTFHSGGNPITDIWKKKFQRPGTEHIIGVIEGNSDEEIIFIDMITVRPGYQRSSIASKMLSIIKNKFPKAKIETSSKTPAGEKFFKSNAANKTHDPINETLVHTYSTDYYGRGNTHVEIFKNPTTSEYRTCVKSGEIGVLLTDKDAYIWDRRKSYHGNAMRQLNLMDGLPLLLIPDLTDVNRVDVLVTDAVKGTRWNHNPNTAEFIENHPFFKGKQIDSINYWDDDIVGDWARLSSDSVEIAK